MINFIRNLWERLFPKPAPWLVNLCGKLEFTPEKFYPTYLNDGYYRLDLRESPHMEAIIFSFEESDIDVMSNGGVMELNSAEVKMLADAIEVWSNSALAEAFFEECDQEDEKASGT